MPNTLCHIGIQGLGSRFFVHPHELTWVVVGCIIPDLSWIWLKLIIPLEIIDPIDLRLYCTAQATLLFCTILSAGICLLTKYPVRVFLILSLNALFHLFLDALQIKWGNGVHFIAPLDYTMLRFDMAWPEHVLTLVFTVFGGLLLIFFWNRMVAFPLFISSLGPFRKLAAILFVSLYMFAPVAFMQPMEEQNVYNLGTLREKELRVGKYVELDRIHFYSDKSHGRLFSGEYVHLTGAKPEKSGRVSFKGQFTSPTTVHAVEYHYHKDSRDLASMIGLFMACALLLHALLINSKVMTKLIGRIRQ